MELQITTAMKVFEKAVATIAADHTIIDPHISQFLFILSETDPANKLDIIRGNKRIGPLKSP